MVTTKDDSAKGNSFEIPRETKHSPTSENRILKEK